MSGFLSSIADKAQNVADKAQSALNSSSISQHIPSSLTGAPHPSHGPSSAPTDSGSTYKTHALDQIQYQFRQLQQNYSTTTPLQKIITAEKGVSLDFESLSRDARSQSKELYMWGRQEHADVKDASDRLAFLNFTAGSLASTLSGRLNTARLPLKELRNSEGPLTQKRNVRNGLELQISRVENSPEKGNEKRLAELKEQLAKAESDVEPAEKQHDILLRKALKESELQKFQALREYGEKLALIAQAAESVLTVLPPVPPSPDRPYTGLEETGSIRASLQHALDNWKPGQTALPTPAEVVLNRSNTGSFGETHAAELQQIESVEHQPVEPSKGDPSPGSQPAATALSSSQTQSVGSINPAALNNEPVVIPSSASPPTAVSLPGSVDSEAKVPTVTPTVAETGVPVSGGPGGPGPSSGSLLNIRSSSSGVSQAGPDVANTPAPEGKQYESAEEEKSRLAREERERLLQGSAGRSDPPDEGPAGDGETPPPYQDI